jgi:predicted CXXCH cytochrome family protein
VKVQVKALLELLALGLAMSLPLAATEHPVKLEKDADCATCHEEKTKGKAVHSAIAMGCTTCHEVKTEGETTTVEFVSPKEQLCYTCHEKAKDPVLHGPYDKGQCVSCHDPHTSEFPKQLRAQTNVLCMGCHGLDRGAKTSDDGKIVTLPWGKEMDTATYQSAPKVVLEKGDRTGHPAAMHPVSGKNTLGKPTDPEITCLSCHVPHNSASKNLMPEGVKSDIEICGRCHK